MKRKRGSKSPTGGSKERPGSRGSKTSARPGSSGSQSPSQAGAGGSKQVPRSSSKNATIKDGGDGTLESGEGNSGAVDSEGNPIQQAEAADVAKTPDADQFVSMLVDPYNGKEICAEAQFMQFFADAL